MDAALSCRFSRCPLTLALVGFALACGTTSDSSSPLASRDAPAGAPASIEVRPSAIRMRLEGTATPTAKTLDATGRSLDGWPVTWRSSDSAIVSVGETSGIVTARAIGVASIIASAAGLHDSTLVVVAATQSLDIAFASLSTIGNYACGLEAVTDLAYCWGDNHSGALGIGDADWEDRPMLVDGGARRFRNVSVSAYYNCAIEVGTDLPYCWGLSPNGQSTVANPYGVSIPTLAGGGRVRFSSISAGTYVTCGVEVSTGLGYCWGRGDLVGDGTGMARTTPTLVGGPGSDLRFASISASPGVVCGIEQDSEVRLLLGAKREWPARRRHDHGSVASHTRRRRCDPFRRDQRGRERRVRRGGADGPRILLGRESVRAARRRHGHRSTPAHTGCQHRSAIQQHRRRPEHGVRRRASDGIRLLLGQERPGIAGRRVGAGSLGAHARRGRRSIRERQHRRGRRRIRWLRDVRRRSGHGPRLLLGVRPPGSDAAGVGVLAELEVAR